MRTVLILLATATSAFADGPPTPPKELNAQELADGLRANEVLARDFFRERWPVVVGDVANVRGRTDDDMVVHLRLSRFQTFYMRVLPSQKPNVLTLAPGDRVRMTCQEFSLTEVGFIPQGQGCVIVSRTGKGGE